MEMEIKREYRLAESTMEIVGKVRRAEHAERIFPRGGTGTDSLLELDKFMFQIEKIL